jgi:K(+)-stimulated pyrophosphate-energized sodium pump
VTELVLIVALEGLALALVLLIVRMHAPRADAIGTGRVLAALQRAAASFLARERLRLAPLAGLAALALLGLEAARGHPAIGIARAVGVLIGAALGAMVAAGGARVGGLAGAATLDAARTRFDSALSAGLRLGGAVGLGAQAAGGLGVLAVFAGEQVLIGAVAPGLGAVGALAESALPAYAVGATLALFTVERAASLYRAAASTGRDHPALRPPRLAATDPQNPALVAGLVGAELKVAAHATRAFALATVFGVLSLLLPSRLGLAPTDAVRLAALGLVLPAFGLVACTTGVLVSRTEEASPPVGGLLRGLGSTAFVSTLGIVAACYWLFPECWPSLSAAGAVGLVMSALSGLSPYPTLTATGAAVRDAQAALLAGGGTASLAGLSSGVRQAAVAIVLLLVGVLASRACGTSSGLVQGERLGMFVALAGAMSILPFVLSAAGLGAVADSALGILAMAPSDAEAARRVKRLEEAARPAGASAESYLTGATGLVAASLGLTLHPQGDVTGGAVLLASAGVAGAAFALTHAGAALSAAVQGARNVTLEVERQLEGANRNPEARNAPPSYRICEEHCARAGLEGAPRAAALTFLPLVLLGIALDLVYRGKSPRLAAEAFAVFTAGAAVTALWVALSANGAHAVLLAVRRASRPEGDPAIFAASVGGSSLTDILGSAVGPTACSLSLMASSIGLLAPFLR